MTDRDIELAINTAAAPTVDSWVTEELRSKRQAAARLFAEDRDGVHRLYRGGIEEMAELGIVELEPLGDRVLTVALLGQDALGGGVLQPEYNSREAIAHRVVALGVGVKKWFDDHGYTDEQRLKPGDLVAILATVSDRVSATDKTCRYWTTRIEHIGSRIKPRG